MKTTKWGNNGWCCLQVMVQLYPEQPTIIDKRNYQAMFTHMANMLPCIHCRRSYRIYILELPIAKFLNDRDSLKYWLYLLHNKVNDKLRSQGYCKFANPKFEDIYENYEKSAKNPNCYWDFLYSIMFNYPLHPSPQDIKNYQLFLYYLTKVFPSSMFAPLYKHYYDNQTPNIKNVLSCRDNLVSWFYNFDYLCKHVSYSQQPNFKSICDKYEEFRASCGSKPSNSCRK